ncbi:MAG: hypothetical protein AB7G44_15725 [Bacteroidia bacterium]
MNIYKREQFKRFTKRFFEDLTNPMIFIKVFTKPWRIPNAIFSLFKNINSIKNNVVFRPDTVEELLSRENSNIEALVTLSGNYHNIKKIKNIIDVFPQEEVNQSDLNVFANLLDNYGSDKVRWNYHIAYLTILKNKKNQPINTLEIGLGTNNIDVLSNMGINGKPGASLRAFRDMYPKAQVFGADIDKRILFTEDRIITLYVDQTNPDTLSELKEQLGNLKFDLIIDDGLHNAQANLNTMNFALEMLKDDGVFVIEDISENDFKYYKIVEAILGDRFFVDFINTNSAHICVFRRKNSVL